MDIKIERLKGKKNIFPDNEYNGFIPGSLRERHVVVFSENAAIHIAPVYVNNLVVTLKGDSRVGIETWIELEAGLHAFRIPGIRSFDPKSKDQYHRMSVLYPAWTKPLFRPKRWIETNEEFLNRVIHYAEKYLCNMEENKKQREIRERLEEEKKENNRLRLVRARQAIEDLM